MMVMMESINWMIAPLKRVKGGKTISKGSYERKKTLLCVSTRQNYMPAHRFHLGIKLEKKDKQEFNCYLIMLPETSSLPLLQPPSIEFINNQFNHYFRHDHPSDGPEGSVQDGETDENRNSPVNVNPDVVIQVECGHNIGYMNLSKLCQGSKGSCIFYNGLYLTPNEFQFVSGRETAKDWKRSIRHNGKSLKLLIKRKLINVHSNSCECFHTNKVTPMEDCTSTSNDEESSGKSSPIESIKLTSIINKIKSSLKAENGQEDEKPGSNNSSGGLNLNEKPNKRRRKEAAAERSSPSESVQSDSEIGIKRSPPSTPHPRNYSDIMRSLAAKYNNLPIEPSVPPQAAALFSRQQLENNRFLKQSLIDMSSTSALLHLVRSADLKKYHQTPLDLTNNNNNNINNTGTNNGTGNKKESKDCCSSQEVTAILNWTVDEVCRFVSSIDLCKEYAEAFRSQSIDGSGLPLLTEEHLTGMGMKLGQALKFKSVLRRRLGNCIICQHCPHCHHSNSNNNTSPSINNNTPANLILNGLNPLN